MKAYRISCTTKSNTTGKIGPMFVLYIPGKHRSMTFVRQSQPYFFRMDKSILIDKIRTQPGVYSDVVEEEREMTFRDIMAVRRTYRDYRDALSEMEREFFLHRPMRKKAPETPIS